MATTKITTRQIKGEPNALQTRRTNAVDQTIEIQEGTYAIGKRFSGVSGISHPDWAGANQVFYIYLDRFDELVLNGITGFPDLSTRIARISIQGGIITAVIDERGHVNGVIDGYQVTYIDGASRFVRGDDVQEALDSIDGYFSSIFTPKPAVLIRQNGEDAYDYPNNSIFQTDGYEYEVGENRLLVTINGIMQYSPLDYTERSSTSIQFGCQLDHDDVIDIFILPGALGGSGNTTTLQGAYYNTEVGDKSIYANEGAVTIRTDQNSGLVVESSNASPALQVTNTSGPAIESAGQVRISSTKAPLNLPVLPSDPASPEDGDTWISNISSVIKINTRVGGVTYSVTLT